VPIAPCRINTNVPSATRTGSDYCEKEDMCRPFPAARCRGTRRETKSPPDTATPADRARVVPRRSDDVAIPGRCRSNTEGEPGRSADRADCFPFLYFSDAEFEAVLEDIGSPSWAKG